MSESKAEETYTLTDVEQRSLEQLEAVVHAGQQTFIEVGKALAEIRDKRLYKQTHSTFESYCNDKWGWGRNYVNKFISAAETTKSLGTTVPKPTSERQVRPLSKLETDDEKYEAWTKAHEIAEEEDVPVTGKLVEFVVSEIQKPITKPEMKYMKQAIAASHMSIAEKAISFLHDIEPNSEGSAEAFKKVISFCRNQLKKEN